MPEAQQKKNDTDTAEVESREETSSTASSDDETPPERPHRVDDDEQDNSGKGRGFIGFIAFVALIVAIGAFVAGYISLQEIGGQQAALGQRIDATQDRLAGLEEGAESIRSLADTVQENNQSMQQRLDAMSGTVDEVSGTVTDLGEKVGSLDDNIDAKLGALEQSDSALQQSLNRLREEISADKDTELLVAEARHLINIANHQARLNHNPSAAAVALENAKQRLGDTGDPALLEIRKTVTDDIIALRNVGQLDISDVALTLSQLEKSVDSLPLRHESDAEAREVVTDPTAAEQEVSGISGFFSKIWNDIKGLVTVRRNSAEDTALLPPGQRFFLQQNLRLKLEAARLALLQRDTATFRSSVETATQWLERYFDTGAASTRNMIATLSPYQALELQPELPDISNSLRALDEWRKQQQSAASEEVAAS